MNLSNSRAFFISSLLFLNSESFAHNKLINGIGVQCQNDIRFPIPKVHSDNSMPWSSPIPQSQLWPEGKVYYKLFPGHYTFEQELKIKEAMQILEGIADIQFIPATTKEGNNHILIKRLSEHNEEFGCFAQVGRVPPNSPYPHPVGLGSACVNDRGTILHELLHVLGFFHEQSREDRDSYVTLLSENHGRSLIENHNYFLYNKHNNTRFTSFDFASIMLYHPYANSINNLPTLLPLRCKADYDKENSIHYSDITKHKYHWWNFSQISNCPELTQMAEHKTNLSQNDIYSLQQMYGKPKSIKPTRPIRDTTKEDNDKNNIKLPPYNEEGYILCQKEGKPTKWYEDEDTNHQEGIKNYHQFSPSDDGISCKLYYVTYTRDKTTDEWVYSQKEFIIQK
ncbi:M12 family metallopeptidase [Silvanigrella aquatica]|uniref:Peptidase M12A domain-containing protein n=1 Tax=Silvanigrella aquatica TaxID=1915309 RepID=A0A1L4D254_9BACT|nr:M12 family metallopeptidase [Silvanigrella aquatica]APJ04271.1 hypothetical protein AXG55_10280 [Silvanigrella aquatica]